MDDLTKEFLFLKKHVSYQCLFVVKFLRSFFFFLRHVYTPSVDRNIPFFDWFINLPTFFYLLELENKYGKALVYKCKKCIPSQNHYLSKTFHPWTRPIAIFNYQFFYIVNLLLCKINVWKMFFSRKLRERYNLKTTFFWVNGFINTIYVCAISEQEIEITDIQGV